MKRPRRSSVKRPSCSSRRGRWARSSDSWASTATERWTQSLRKGLASPQLAGIRIVDGVPITGSWPAILDVETHQAIVAELNKPERGRGTTGR